MKKLFLKKKTIIYSIIISLSITFFFSCTNPLEYGSDFEFKINDIDNNSIVIKNEKNFSLELTSFFNKENNLNFKLSYDTDNLELIKDNITLIKNIDYDFTFSDLKKLDLKVKPIIKGDITLSITLTDSYGLTRKKIVIIKAVEDLNFSFTNVEPAKTYVDILSTTFNFNLNLKNIGSSLDTYQIKALPSRTGTILINNNLIQAGELKTISEGNISVSFTPEILGGQTISFIVINSKNIEKEIIYNLNINQKIFTINAVTNLSLKQSISGQFSFVTSSTIPNWQYQVKFRSTLKAKIYSSIGVLIPLDTYVDLPINSTVFNYSYISDVIGLDQLEISVKDKNSQTVTTNLPITVYGKPTFTINPKIVFTTATNNPYNFVSLSSEYSFNDVKTFGKDVTIVAYEFKIFNYKTKQTDTYTDSKNLNMYPVEQDYYIWYLRTNLELNKKINYYDNQNYTARIKDSDGIWSETISGTMHE